MTSEQRKDTISERVEDAIKKLRLIRKRSKDGDRVPSYHFDDLADIIASLRHNTDMLNEANGFSE